MSEDRVLAEGQEKPDLKEQARFVREQIREARKAKKGSQFSLLARAAYLISIFTVLSLSFLLLASAGSRERVLKTVAGVFLDLEPISDEVFELPAPPPQPTETVAAPAIRIAGSTVTFTADGLEGVLYATINAPGSQPEGEAKEGDGFAPPPKTGEVEAAFALLKEKSPAAAELADGLREGFEFQEWSPLKSDPPVFFIDLLVTRASDGQLLHLVWEVNTEKEEVRPMSQAARDLAR